MSAFLASYLVSSAMDGKFKQCVSIKFCLKLSNSTAKIHEMLLEAFGE
jgi:hypothetical protein